LDTLLLKAKDTWDDFLEFALKKCSSAEFNNWIEPIKFLEGNDIEICLQVPNIFVQEYLLENFKQDLLNFLPTNEDGNPAINFTVAEPEKKPLKTNIATQIKEAIENKQKSAFDSKLNPSYVFENFIEGPANQFVKSAAIGIANRPGKSFNPLFIHGGVGIHLLIICEISLLIK